MPYYLLPDNLETEGRHFKVVFVHSEDKDAFLLRYSTTIIYEGESIATILIQFSKKLDHLKPMGICT